MAFQNIQELSNLPQKSDIIPMSDKLYIERSKVINTIYYSGFNMPLKSLNFQIDTLLDKYMKDVYVLFNCISNENFFDQLELVKKLVSQRIPCNIAGTNYFDSEKLKLFFGWDQAFYDIYYNTTNKLAPNIGILCRTPIFTDNIFSKNKKIDIWVINLIALALDNPNQSDFKYLANLGHINARKYVEIHMINLWTMMCEAALLIGLSKINYCEVGGGAFSHYLKILTDISYSELLNNTLPLIIEQYKDKLLITKLSGFIPECLFDNNDFNNTLFVNAWDPLTLVGNGNYKDNSLDGYFGRCSSMGLLCWSETNSWLKQSTAYYCIDINNKSTYNINDIKLAHELLDMARDYGNNIEIWKIIIQKLRNNLNARLCPYPRKYNLLHHASYWGIKEIAEILINEFKFNPNTHIQNDKANLTAIDIAKSLNHLNLVSYFTQL